MDTVYKCEKCSTAVVVEMGMNHQYWGPVLRCGLCNTILVMSSVTLTPHLVPTRPVKTLYWTGILTSFPPLTIEPLIVEDTLHWVTPPFGASVSNYDPPSSTKGNK